LRIEIVICDLDRYATNAPIILAARSLGIPSATIVHGSVSPIDNYIPVIADYFLGWGNYHEAVFRSHLEKKGRGFRIIGNPKFPEVHKRRHKEISIIGLATSPLPEDVNMRIVDAFEKGTRSFEERKVKIHPLEKVEFYAEVLKGRKDIIIDSNNSSDSFLKEIDALCVRNSQIGSDAMAYQIPIIVLDCNGKGELQNGQLLAEKADCPIVKNDLELSVEISKLKSDKSYYDHRINRQNQFMRELVKYAGIESDKQMLKFIVETISRNENN
jgi:hypothetical protein